MENIKTINQQKQVKMKNQNTMKVKDMRNIETAIQGISTYELQKELSVDNIFLTESQFNSYANNRINGDTKSEALRFVHEDINYDFFEDEDNEKKDLYVAAVNNFFWNGEFQGVQSVEEALLVLEWIQAKYSASMPDVKLKYDADKESLHNYIIKNS